MQLLGDNPSNRQLESWKDIANYLKTSVRTAQRWEEKDGLPVTRILREKRSAVYANTEDLDRWLATRTISSASDAEPPSRPPRNLWLPAIVILAAVLSISALYWSRAKHQAEAQILQPTRLTSYPGIETQPVLSPDGQLLAFAFFHDGLHGIAIQPPNSATPERFFTTRSMTYGPQWSPDSRQLVFLVSVNSTASNLMLFDIKSRALRKIAEVLGHNWFDASVHSFPALQWTPDGRAILIADGENGIGTSLIRFDLTTQARSLVYTLPSGSRMRAFAFSPSFRQLALVIQSGNQYRLHTLDFDSQLLPTGQPKPVLSDAAGTESPAWLPNGDLLFIHDQRELWRVRGNHPERLHINGPLPAYTLSAATAGRLFWSHTSLDTSLTFYDPVKKTYGKSVCDSTTLDRQPRLAPDGKHLLFNSLRNGFINLWLCGTPSNELRQLTKLEETGLWDAEWSPDSSMVSFAVNNTQRSVIVVVRASDGNVIHTISGPGTRLSPTWAPDGKQIYFIQESKDHFQLQSYDLSSSVTTTGPLLDGPKRILMRADGRFWIHSRDTLALFTPAPVSEQKIVAKKVSALITLTPDRLGTYFEHSVSTALVGGSEFRSIDASAKENRITPALPDSMGYGPAPNGLLFIVRATSTNSDIYRATLHAK